MHDGQKKGSIIVFFLTVLENSTQGDPPRSILLAGPYQMFFGTYVSRQQYTTTCFRPLVRRKVMKKRECVSVCVCACTWDGRVSQLAHSQGRGQSKEETERNGVAAERVGETERKRKGGWRKREVENM